jgi:hypothetical protein
MEAIMSTKIEDQLSLLATASCDPWLCAEQRHLDHEKICTEAAKEIRQLRLDLEKTEKELDEVEEELVCIRKW